MGSGDDFKRTVINKSKEFLFEDWNPYVPMMLVPSMLLPLSLLLFFNINKSFCQNWYDYNENQDYHNNDKIQNRRKEDYNDNQGYHNKDELKNIEDEDEMRNDYSNDYLNDYSNDNSNGVDDMGNDYSNDEKKKDTKRMERRLIQSKRSCNIKNEQSQWHWQ